MHIQTGNHTFYQSFQNPCNSEYIQTRHQITPVMFSIIHIPMQTMQLVQE